MPDPITEVKDICEKLLLESQHTMLRYAQIAQIAENAVRKSTKETSDSDDNSD